RPVGDRRVGVWKIVGGRDGSGRLPGNAMRGHAGDEDDEHQADSLHDDVPLWGRPDSTAPGLKPGPPADTWLMNASIAPPTAAGGAAFTSPGSARPKPYCATPSATPARRAVSASTSESPTSIVSAGVDDAA